MANNYDFSRDLKFSFKIHQFQVTYWASFAKQHGSEMRGHNLDLGVGLTLTLVPTDDGLHRRPQTNWRIREFNSELDSVTVWLLHSQRDKLQVYERLIYINETGRFQF